MVIIPPPPPPPLKNKNNNKNKNENTNSNKQFVHTMLKLFKLCHLSIIFRSLSFWRTLSWIEKNPFIKVQAFLKPKYSLASFNISMRLAFKFSVIEISVFLASLYLTTYVIVSHKFYNDGSRFLFTVFRFFIFMIMFNINRFQLTLLPNFH